MLTARDRNKLVAVLGLLASDKDGERSAAAWTAARMLRDRGLSWDTLIPHALAPPDSTSRPEPRQSAPLYPWSVRLQFVLARFPYLTDWEKRFTSDLQYRRKLSPKQDDALNRIYSRLAGQAAQ